MQGLFFSKCLGPHFKGQPSYKICLRLLEEKSFKNLYLSCKPINLFHACFFRSMELMSLNMEEPFTENFQQERDSLVQSKPVFIISQISISNAVPHKSQSEEHLVSHKEIKYETHSALPA